MINKKGILLFVFMLFFFNITNDLEASKLSEYSTKDVIIKQKAVENSAGVVDANLKKALNEELNKKPGVIRPLDQDITKSEMESFTGTLYLSKKGISDISGLEYATNITSLKIGINSISDLSPISNLTNLKHLEIFRNDISDVSALSNLVNLENINMFMNDVSDISAFSNMSKLTSLNAGTNNVSDLSPLSNLTNLKSLSLYSNNISDITPISKLTNLTSLSLSNNKISDVSALSSMTKLRTLEISNNNVSDISYLNGLPSLRSFSAPLNRISDLRPLGQITPLPSYSVYDQILVKEDLVSHSDDDGLKYFVYDADGTKYDVEFGEVKKGTNVYNGFWNNNDSKNKYSGLIKYTYTYEPLLTSNEKPIIKSDDIETIEVDKKLSEKEIIDLYDVLAFDFEDRELTDIKVDISKVDFNKIGTYSIFFSVSDSIGNKIEKEVKLKVVDNRIPEIKADEEKTIEVSQIKEVKELLNLFNVSVSDKKEELSVEDVNIEINKIDFNVVGTYIIKFSITNNLGNTSEVISKLHIVDKVEPVILADKEVSILVNEKKNLDEILKLFKVSVTDNVDNLSIKDLEIDMQDVDFSKVGTYKIIFKIKDMSGNESKLKVKLHVLSNEKPKINGVDDAVIYIGEDFDYLYGVKAIDKEDGDLTSKIKVNGKVDINTLGDYIIEYKVIDSNGNEVIVKRKVTVKPQEEKKIIEKVFNINSSINKPLITTGKKSIFYLLLAFLIAKLYMLFTSSKKHKNKV